MRKLANFLGFQAVWWSSILGAASGRVWLGPAVLLPAGSLHLTGARDRRAEALTMATAGLAGWLADSALTAAGLLRFGDASTAPLWMAGLWVAFAATLGSSLSWLRGRPWIAALFGALGGPLAYGGGARLEALGTTATGLGAVAVEWALAAPALVRIHGVFTGGER